MEPPCRLRLVFGREVVIGSLGQRAGEGHIVSEQSRRHLFRIHIQRSFAFVYRLLCCAVCSMMVMLTRCQQRQPFSSFHLCDLVKRSSTSKHRLFFLSFPSLRFFSSFLLCELAELDKVMSGRPISPWPTSTQAWYSRRQAWIKSSQGFGRQAITSSW